MTKRPNLLFIYTDEQRFDTLAAYGNTRIDMPNLNRLADRSCVVDRAYVTQPVCTPSRSSLLTGCYPHNTGCTANNLPLDSGIPCRTLASADQQRLAVADPLRTIMSADGRWKLNVSPSLGQHELYDLLTDPGECDNRYGSAGTSAVVGDLLGQLQAWQQRTRDPVALHHTGI